MIKLGVIGYGQRLHSLVKTAFRPLGPNLRVVGVVDPDESSVRERLEERDRDSAVFYKSLPELVRYAKPDALAIGTRCARHAPYAIQAARYDLPLFLEKPVAITMKQARGLEKAFVRSRCRVVVSFPLRVSPLCVLAHQLIHKEKAVGTPEHILAVNYVPYGTCYWDISAYQYRSVQGLFLQKATHDFDYMSFLMGSPIVRVAAMATWGHVFGGRKPAGLVCSRCKEQRKCLESPANRRRNKSGGTTADHDCTFSIAQGTPARGMNEDSSSALVEFASGAHGVYTQVFYARRDAATRGATVSGYLGTVGFDWYQNELKRVRHHAPFTDVVKAGAGLSHFGGDDELGRNFLDVITGHAKSLTPIQAGIQSVYACLAAKESALTGRMVRVRQLA
jgi:predicted dehydrogenase